MNGIRLGMYDNIKKFLNFESKTFHLLSSMINGGFSGYVSGIISAPFNLVKTRIMLESNFLQNGDRYHYKGVRDAFH